jgi:hypothetical protein
MFQIARTQGFKIEIWSAVLNCRELRIRFSSQDHKNNKVVLLKLIIYNVFDAFPGPKVPEGVKAEIWAQEPEHV